MFSQKTLARTMLAMLEKEKHTIVKGKDFRCLTGGPV